MNIPLTRPQLTAALDAAFPTTAEITDIPLSRTQELTAKRFAPSRMDVSSSLKKQTANYFIRTQ